MRWPRCFYAEGRKTCEVTNESNYLQNASLHVHLIQVKTLFLSEESFRGNAPCGASFQ